MYTFKFQNNINTTSTCNKLVPNDTKVEYNSKLIIVQTNFKLVMCFANIIILLICKMKTERVKYK